MKAISLKQPYASWIASGIKTIETRKWPTKYRGDIVIVSSLKPVMKGYPVGVALCITEIIDCRPMIPEDEKRAMCAIYPRAWSWILQNARPLMPFPVKGKLGIYDIAGSKVLDALLADKNINDILAGNF